MLTDDAVSRDLVVPIFYIHSFEQPFCTNRCCQCQVNRSTTVQLFRQIIEGKLELEQAAQIAGRTV